MLNYSNAVASHFHFSVIVLVQFDALYCLYYMLGNFNAGHLTIEMPHL